MLLRCCPRFFALCPSRVDQAAVDQLSHWETEKANFEGLRVIVDEGEGRAGWLLNRMSLHEPIVIFTVESVSCQTDRRHRDFVFIPQKAVEQARAFRAGCFAGLP